METPREGTGGKGGPGIAIGMGRHRIGIVGMGRLDGNGVK